MVIYIVSGLIGVFISDFASGSISTLLLGLILILVSLVVSYLFIRRAKLRCPKELKEGLYRAIFIATVGVMGTYCRYTWNVCCGIMSVIPGFGWMAKFVITKDTLAKKDLIKAGERWDKEYEEQMRQEEENRKAEEERQREEREEMENDLRKKVWKEQNRTDIVFNSDSSRWRYSDEDVWRKTEKKL